MSKPAKFTVQRHVRISPETDELLVKKAEKEQTKPAILARKLIEKGLSKKEQS